MNWSDSSAPTGTDFPEAIRCGTRIREYFAELKDTARA